MTDFVLTVLKNVFYTKEALLLSGVFSFFFTQLNSFKLMREETLINT